MKRIAIIGTAGRREDGAKMSRDLYIKMVNSAATLLDHLVPNIQDRHLVSGGAAWADHIAVSLFLMKKAARFTLYAPCDWNRGFVGNADANTANYYHSLFSQKLGKNTLDGIQRALDAGAEFVPGRGFKQRNLHVANCDIMLAYTWGPGDTPKDGGTAHTWGASRAPQKYHVPLDMISRYTEDQESEGLVQFVRGNLLEANTDALVNTVNCVGVMGKGIAKDFKAAYPDMFEDYREACAENRVTVGVVIPYGVPGPGKTRWVFNFPTKDDWRNPSKIAWIKAGLAHLGKLIPAYNIKSIAIPPLGCGNGGLDWNEVRPLIVEAAQTWGIPVKIYGEP